MERTTKSKLLWMLGAIAIAIAPGCDDSEGRPDAPSPRIEPTPTQDTDGVIDPTGMSTDTGMDTEMDTGMDTGKEPQLPPDETSGSESGTSHGGSDDDASGGSKDSGAAPCAGFECVDGGCIDSSWVCDDIPDCPGGEDEFHFNCGGGAG